MSKRLLESGSSRLLEDGTSIRLLETSGSSGTISENFDGVTAPALPAGWNAGGIATWTTSTNAGGFTPPSSPNMLEAAVPTGGTFSFLTYGTADSNSGNGVVAAKVNASGTSHGEKVGVTARGTAATLDATSTSCYAGWFDVYSWTAAISKVVNGTETVLSATITAASFPTGWPLVSLSAVGTALALTIQDTGNSQYLNSSGAWQAGSTTCATVTDSSLTGAGYWGVLAKSPGAAFTGVYDDWSLAPPPPTATAAVTLGPTVAAGTGTFTATATASPTLGGLTAAATGTAGSFGSASPTLGPMTAAASGTFRDTATAASTLGPMTGAGSGTFTASATAAPTLGPMAGAGTGTFTTAGSASVTLGPMTAAGSAFAGVFATASPTLGGLTAAATGTFTTDASASPALGGLTASGSGTATLTASAAITLGPTAPAAIGTFATSGSAAPTLGAMAGAGSAFSGAFASAGVTLGPTTASGSGTFTATATAGPTLGPMVAAGSAFGPSIATASITLGPMAAAAAATASGGASTATAGITLGGTTAVASAFGSTFATAAIALAPLQVWGGNQAVLYHVYASPSAGQPIDYDTPVAIVSSLTWTSGTLTTGTWSFGVRASNNSGIEQNLDASVKVIVAADGTDVTSRPDAPTGLRAHAAAGGSIVVAWSYASTDASRKPTEFRVYTGTGGTPNYATAAATKAYGTSIAGSYQVTLTGLTDGTTYSIGVRAYNASGGEETNQTVVSCTADATGPAAVTGLSAAAVT